MVSAPKIETVIMIAVSLMVVAIIIPLSIGLISVADQTVFNYTGASGSTQTTLGNAADPAVITILTVLLPIVAIIGILMYYIPNR
jgi:hypothetical protein